ncbi:hypothetical protein V6N11_060689 [Hibiscus sabdariffa]|uniref:Exostosin GT47 domain-containing protein n=1 Tax=Hibiscus sabdariffa TaxID=183260 RepID=A0ABR2QR24_9ROSI
MAIKSSTATVSKAAKPLFFTLALLLSLSFFIVVLFFTPATKPTNSFPQSHFLSSQNSIKVYVANLPRSLNYGLLQQYWDSNHPDSRIPTDPDHRISTTHISKPAQYPPYPENPLIKQYSAEYWLMGDLETPQEMRAGSFAKRVFDANEADVVFVPFFATLSAEMELGSGSGAFRKKAGNGDYSRQKKVIDFVRNTDAWKRSGGRDHVFVLTGCVKP